MLLLLIIPVWSIGLVILAGLCFAARVGDRSLQSELEAQRAEAPPQLPAARHRERHRIERRELVA